MLPARASRTGPTRRAMASPASRDAAIANEKLANAAAASAGPASARSCRNTALQSAAAPSAKNEQKAIMPSTMTAPDQRSPRLAWRGGGSRRGSPVSRGAETRIAAAAISPKCTVVLRSAAAAAMASPPPASKPMLHMPWNPDISGLPCSRSTTTASAFVQTSTEAATIP